MEKELKEKAISVAMKYAELLEKKIDKALENEKTTDLAAINDGIKIFHHATGAVFKLDAYGRKLETHNEVKSDNQ